MVPCDTCVSRESLSSQLVCVDFTATWCGPCKKIAPKFLEMAGTYDDCEFVKVRFVCRGWGRSGFEHQRAAGSVGVRVTEQQKAAPFPASDFSCHEIRLTSTRWRS